MTCWTRQGEVPPVEKHTLRRDYNLSPGAPKIAICGATLAEGVEHDPLDLPRCESCRGPESTLHNCPDCGMEHRMARRKVRR